MIHRADTTLEPGADHGHRVIVSLPGIAQVEFALNSANSLLPDDQSLVSLSWDQLQPGLKQAIQADFTSAWFMYGVLIVLVAFSVLNTQLMSVLERTREFGVLTALGLKPSVLAGLVITESAMMAAIGLVIGVVLGWSVTAWFATNGLAIPGGEELMQRYNMPSRIYPSVQALTLLMGPSVVFVFSLLASVYPALRLFRLHPVEAMRSV